MRINAKFCSRGHRFDQILFDWAWFPYFLRVMGWTRLINFLWTCPWPGCDYLRPIFCTNTRLSCSRHAWLSFIYIFGFWFSAARLTGASSRWLGEYSSCWVEINLKFSFLPNFLRENSPPRVFIGRVFGAAWWKSLRPRLW